MQSRKMFSDAMLPHRDERFARLCSSQGHVVLGVPHVLLISNANSEQNFMFTGPPKKY